MTENKLLTVFHKLLSAAAGEGVKIVIMGGMAVSAYAPPRTTFDIDGIVEIEEERIEGFLRRLKKAGFSTNEAAPVKVINGLPFITLYYPRSKVYVDLFLARNEFQKQMMARSWRITVEGLTLEIVSPEDLILVKLLTGRPRDTEDVRQILLENSESLDFGYLRGWARRLGVAVFLEDEIKSLGIKPRLKGE